MLYPTTRLMASSETSMYRCIIAKVVHAEIVLQMTEAQFTEVVRAKYIAAIALSATEFFVVNTYMYFRIIKLLNNFSNVALRCIARTFGLGTNECGEAFICAY